MINQRLSKPGVYYSWISDFLYRVGGSVSDTSRTSGGPPENPDDAPSPLPSTLLIGLNLNAQTSTTRTNNSSG